jgi:type 1 glutamine amidotransferase
MLAKYRRIAVAGIALLAVVSPGLAADGDKIRVLIIDGENNHAWQQTTPLLKKALESSGRFHVDVATTPQKPKLPPEPSGASEKELAQYKEALANYADAYALFRSKPPKFEPDLAKYAVVLSNYNGSPWPEPVRKSLEDKLKAADVGLVVFHAANNAFTGWPEFNRMIGMGWRGNSFGDRLYFTADGKEIRQTKGQGAGAGETSIQPFKVVIRNADHPITKDMPREWMHAPDQLVHGLRGPIENVEVLATAWSDKAKGGTGEHEPMIWTVAYGKGRVFHTPMGHDATSVRCVGFLTMLQRGTEWAATGTVTVPIPPSFPTIDKPSLLSEK